MNKRKILYITGTRADYGLMRFLLSEINKNPKLDLEIVATGMHLMEEFGSTISEIRKDGFKVHEIKAVYGEDNKLSMAKFIGEFIQLLSDKIEYIKPDIILLLGDRAEMLAGAIVGTYLSIPVAHIHGGDVTSTVDDNARHAITKLAHIHFPATEMSADRIIKMSEDSWRVYNVGSPAIDSLLNEDYLTPDRLATKYGLNISEPVLMVVQHPVTMEYEDSAIQIRETLDSVKELGYQTIVVYPNSDAGGRLIIKAIEDYEKYPFIKVFKSLPHQDYVSLMKYSQVIIGNSSSGIIEAPFFHLPAVNIGTRQKGRDMGINVLNVGYNKKEIKEAIKKALFDEYFKGKVKESMSLYGEGRSSEKIIEILLNQRIGEALLQKNLILEGS